MSVHHHPDLSLAQQVAASLDWWRDAGVDCLFVDEPLAMLGEVADDTPAVVVLAVPPPVEAVAESAVPAIAVADLPPTLAEFAQFWCDPALFLPQLVGPRPAPIGVAEAALMIIAPMPEAGDTSALLSGGQGRLIGNILKALNIPADRAYLTTALPAAQTMPDWANLAAHGLGVVLGHHIALARPQRVLVLGNKIEPLLAGGCPVPLLTSYAPDQLLAHPRERARLWQRLLEWTRD